MSTSIAPQRDLRSLPGLCWSSACGLVASADVSGPCIGNFGASQLASIGSLIYPGRPCLCSVASGISECRECCAQQCVLFTSQRVFLVQLPVALFRAILQVVD